MKKSMYQIGIIAVMFFFSLGQTLAQDATAKKSKISNSFELSSNPIALLFEAVPISFQKPISKDFEIGADLFFLPKYDYKLFYGKCAYYFNPEMGADKFHIGSFAGLLNNSVGIGFFVGYKIVSERGVFLNLGTGIGRGFRTENSPESRSITLPYAQLHVGYRFGQKEIK